MGIIICIMQYFFPIVEQLIIEKSFHLSKSGCFCGIVFATSAQKPSRCCEKFHAWRLCPPSIFPESGDFLKSVVSFKAGNQICRFFYFFVRGNVVAHRSVVESLVSLHVKITGSSKPEQDCFFFTGFLAF